MFLLFVTGFVHNNNLAYITLFFVFSLSFTSVIIGRIYIKNAKIKLLTKRCFAKQNCVLNFKKDKFLHSQNNKVFVKRGYNEFETVVYSDYPLKLVKFFKNVKFKILVYPELKGEDLNTFTGSKLDDNDFEGLKNYNFEDIKYIHWGSVAKGSIQVKKFNAFSDTKLKFYYLKINGNKEDKISQLALWAYEAFSQGREFEIIFPDVKIESKEGFDEVFKKLALY